MTEIAKAATYSLTVERLGDRVAFVVPDELLERLRVSEGDVVQVVEDEPGRGFTLMPADSVHERAMTIARELFVTYAETFRALAK